MFPLGQYRSVLFTPGNDDRKLRKLTGLSPDIGVIDLEDSVPAVEKQESRIKVRKYLDDSGASSARFVRINDVRSSYFERDVYESVGPGLTGLVVPKLEDPSDLLTVDRLVSQAEARTRQTPGVIKLIGIIESAKGVVAAEAIAATAPRRVITFCFGSGDFSKDVGVPLTVTGDELAYARSRIVVAVRAAELPPPIDGPFLNLDDLGGLHRESLRSKSLGFQGRIALNPDQIPVINEVYGLIAGVERTEALAIVRAYERAMSKGVGAITVNGSFVDKPVYERAKASLTQGQIDEA